MPIKLILSSKEILNKEFSNAPRGYEPFAVDEFLDKILKDYKSIEDSVILTKKEKEDFDEEIQQLKEEKNNLLLELQKCKDRLANIDANDDVGTNNIELIRRINILEKFLFNHGYNPQLIK